MIERFDLDPGATDELRREKHGTWVRYEDTIDAAWAEAEAALPVEEDQRTKPQWRIDEVGRFVGHWNAVAVRSVVPVWAKERTDWDIVSATAHTPALALRELALKLRRWEKPPIW